MSIELVLQRLGIEAKKKGREWHALCPNPGHKDRSPSWRIRDEPGAKRHGLHQCFPCGFGGTLADLVMALKGVEYRAAREWLGDDTPGDDMPIVGSVQLKVRPPGRNRFKLPAGVEVAELDAWVTPAREYMRKRGIDRSQVSRWGLGYAVDGPLGGRIVIPYRDARGRPRGYTARTYTGALKRYKEPDEWEGADLSVMFGEQHWDQHRDAIYVTEGAFNALAVESALAHRAEEVCRDIVPHEENSNFPAVAATSGSSLRTAHERKLAGFGRVVVLTDPDAAGDRIAAEIGECLARHAEVVRVRLPEGTDAADLPRDELRRILGQHAGHLPGRGL